MEEKKILNTEVADENLEDVTGGVVYVTDTMFVWNQLPEGYKYVCPSCGGDLRKEFYKDTMRLAYFCSSCDGFPNKLKQVPKL